MNSLSPIFFYKFNITNSFPRINLGIRKYLKKFVRIRTTSFWFVFVKSVLCCERPVLYVTHVPWDKTYNWCTWLLWKHCYHGNKGLFNNSTIWTYFMFVINSSYLIHMLIGIKCITGLLCCYGNTVPDMLLRIIHISILPSYCRNTVTHQNQMLTSRGNSLLRTISSSKISHKSQLSHVNTMNNPLPNFSGQILHTPTVLHIYCTGSGRLPLRALCYDQRSLFHCVFSITFYYILIQELTVRLFLLESHTRLEQHF